MAIVMELGRDEITAAWTDGQTEDSGKWVLIGLARLLVPGETRRLLQSGRKRMRERKYMEIEL